MATSEYHLAGFIPLVQKWRWPILGLTAAALLLSTIISLLLPNIYRSTAVFYPTTLPNLEATLNTEAVITGEKLELSMSSDDADRLISIGQSQALLQTIIDKYHFTERYGYNPADSSDKTKQKVVDEFLYNYNIYQNNRSAVEVSFDNVDKHLAAQVANAIMQGIDSVNQQLTRQNQINLVNTYHQRQLSLQKSLEDLQTQLVSTRQKYGILSSSSSESEARPESNYLAERLLQTESDLRKARATLKSFQTRLPTDHARILTLKAEITGLEAALFGLKNSAGGSSINLESYLAGTDELSKLEHIFTKRQEEYVKAVQAYEDAKITLANKTTSMYVVQKAMPAFKKIKPVRWLIVLGATCFTFILSLVAASIAERLFAARREAFYV